MFYNVNGMNMITPSSPFFQFTFELVEMEK